MKTLQDYGLRLTIYLAMHDCVCSSREISEAIDVPRPYLLQIAQLLRKGGIIQTHAGKNGGYSLAKPPTSITLFELLTTLKKAASSTANPSLPEAPTITEDPKEPALDAPSPLDDISNSTSDVMANVFSVLQSVASSYNDYMDSITLEMLIVNSQDLDNVDKYLSETLAQHSLRLEQRHASSMPARTAPTQHLQSAAQTAQS